MLHSVALVRTRLFDGRYRLHHQDDKNRRLGTTLAVFLCYMLRLLVTANVPSPPAFQKTAFFIIWVVLANNALNEYNCHP
jgi:hypothetical protein